MMKNIILSALLLAAVTGYAQRSKPAPSDTKTTQMEKLDRGGVLIKRPGTSTTAYFLSWRLLGTDDENTTFTLLRNGQPYANGKVYTNTTGVNVLCSSTQYFQIVTLKNGEPVETSDPIYPWGKSSLEIPLEIPAKGTNGGTYTPNDCSVGDVDGDGQYEIILKWDPSNSKDNSNTGNSDPVIFDCYKLNGTRLWRLDLGVNIRAGAHYTQFMVYDFDKDGKAEMICKTAPGSKGGKYPRQDRHDLPEDRHGHSGRRLCHRRRHARRDQECRQQQGLPQYGNGRERTGPRAGRSRISDRLQRRDG